VLQKERPSGRFFYACRSTTSKNTKLTNNLEAQQHLIITLLRSTMKGIVSGAGLFYTHRLIAAINTKLTNNLKTKEDTTF